MSKEEKLIRSYTRAVVRKLNLPRDVKKRVMADLTSSIQSRLEAGKRFEEIRAELGTPAAAAAELNEQLKEFAYGKSPWRWVCLGLAALSGLVLLYKGSVGLLAALMAAAMRESVGIIGGVDGPVQVFVTQSPDAAAHRTVMAAVVLVMGIAGFWFLGHMRKK